MKQGRVRMNATGCLCFAFAYAAYAKRLCKNLQYSELARTFGSKNAGEQKMPGQIWFRLGGQGCPVRPYPHPDGYLQPLLWILIRNIPT